MASAKQTFDIYETKLGAPYWRSDAVSASIPIGAGAAASQNVNDRVKSGHDGV